LKNSVRLIVVDSITRKQAIELGKSSSRSRSWLSTFELSVKSKAFCKRRNDENVIADDGPCASCMTRKHSPNEVNGVIAKRTVSIVLP